MLPQYELTHYNDSSLRRIGRNSIEDAKHAKQKRSVGAGSEVGPFFVIGTSQNASTLQNAQQQRYMSN